MREGLIICKANQWTGSYMTGTSVMKEFITKQCSLGIEHTEAVFQSSNPRKYLR